MLTRFTDFKIKASALRNILGLISGYNIEQHKCTRLETNIISCSDTSY